MSEVIKSKKSMGELSRSTQITKISFMRLYESKKMKLMNKQKVQNKQMEDQQRQKQIYLMNLYIFFIVSINQFFFIHIFFVTLSTEMVASIATPPNPKNCFIRNFMARYFSFSISSLKSLNSY